MAKGGRGRRNSGEGLIRRRADGRWEARLVTEGKAHSYYGDTKMEALGKLNEARREVERGFPLVEERQTVEQFLHAWLETIRPPRLIEETWDRYRECVELHIIPSIGKVRLSQLTAQRVQLVYAEVANKGRSPSTVRHVHAVLHRALESALRLGLVARNVSDMVEKPRKAHHEMTPLTREQTVIYVRAAADDRMGAFFLLAVATGMRVGELLALRWGDVRRPRHVGGTEGNTTISVNATLKWRNGMAILTPPKTVYSRRLIAVAPPVMDMLRRHRQQQWAEQRNAGSAWQARDFVFSDEVGGPLKGDYLRHRHNRILRSAGLPRIRLHDLRHTCATLLLAEGVNPKIVSSMLGHSSVAITLDIYSHVLPHMLDDAASAVVDALGWVDASQTPPLVESGQQSGQSDQSE